MRTGNQTCESQMSLPLDWEIKGNPVPEFGFAVTGFLSQFVREKFPDIVDLFPFRIGFDLKIDISDGQATFVIRDQPQSNVPTMGQGLPPDAARKIREAYQKHPLDQFPAIANEIAPTLMGPSVFAYSGPFKAPHASWQHLRLAVVRWLQHVSAPAALGLNQRRVLRAVPPQPDYDIGAIQRSTWVLECQETMRQGTAFQLSGVGIMSCEHVLGTKTQAYRPENPTKKYDVTVVAANADLDLSILSVASELTGGLVPGSTDSLEQLDPIGVAGFPNHRVGDTLVLNPGFITGFRMVSGIRRLLTDAPIIAGMSGGPVIGQDNQVLGVCVTGADRMESAQSTEHHSIVPIDALKFLRRDAQ